MEFVSIVKVWYFKNLIKKIDSYYEFGFDNGGCLPNPSFRVIFQMIITR